MTARERLAAIQGRDAKVRAELAKPGVGDDGLMAVAMHLAVSQSDVAPLVAALTAVLDLHPRSAAVRCMVCVDAAGNPQYWPCETVTAITAALEGGSS